jgi:membrane protease YdiL (CAAX protease family)
MTSRSTCAVVLLAFVASGRAMAAAPSTGPGPAFGEGSHEAFGKRINASHAAEYRRVLAEYDAYLKRHPDDSIAAVERCRLIDVFAYAEESAIEAAATDSEQCHGALRDGALADTAAVKLFLWEQEWSEEATAQGEAMLKESASWTVAQRATLHEMLANRYYSEEPLKSGEHSLAAVKLNPASRHRLQAANHLVRIGAKGRAVAMIEAMPADQWQPWTLSSAVTTLTGMGEVTAAGRLTRAHSDIKLPAAARAKLARSLFEAGEADEARALMKALLEEPGNPLTYGHALELELFEFQRAFGERDDAIAAYRKLRDKGYDTDAFGRHRLSLSVRYPDAPWKVADLLGIAGLLALLGLLAFLPAAVVVPLHYRSLAKRVRGVMPGERSSSSPWGLGQLWYALSALLVGGGLSAYLFCYPLLESLMGVGRETPLDERALARALLCGEAICLLALLPLLRGTDPRRLLLGQWTPHKSVLAGIGMSIVVLMANAMLLAAMKGGAEPGIALGNDTIRAMQGLYSLYGAAGLLLVAALLAPVVEEFVFRGVFLQTAARYVRLWVAALAQALVFVAWHDQPHAYPALFMLAVLAAWLAWRSGGLLAPIALHVTNNAFAAMAIMGITRSLNAVP